MSIHPSAIIDPKASLGKNVSVGPYCVVGPHVVLDDHVTLHAHVVVDGHTHIGHHTTIFPFAAIGTIPQDLKFDGEPSTLSIGCHNMIREHVTMNPGTKGGGSKTTVGDHGLFMVACHVAHDCIVGNHVILANNATLAGHVEVGDHAIIGGLSAVHQFVRIGRHAMIGGMSGIENDIIPYGQASGDRAHLSGLNLIGLKRRGFSREDIQMLRRIYKMLFLDQTKHFAQRVTDVEQEFGQETPIMEIVNFIHQAQSRSLCQPKIKHS